MSLNKMEPVKQHGSGKKFAGLIVVLVGVALLLKKSGVIMPDWLFSWQMLLVVIGLFIGVKHGFKNHAWWIMTLIGLVFMADNFIYDWSIRQYFWPVVVIAVGLAMIFSKRHKRWDGSAWKDGQFFEENMTDGSDRLDSVAVFGSVKKNIVSKNFRGGEMVSVFGGSELNLTQAEINGPVRIELVNIMGGTKLIIPSNWEVRSEVVSIFGGIEDKRQQAASVPTGEKVLFIDGVSLFGGIEIKSF